MNARAEVQLQVIWNRFLAIVEEEAQSLMRTAFSSTVREAGDMCAGLFDAQGRMVAQAVTGTPGHVNTMAAAVKHLLGRFPLASMAQGDQYITNDPWLASGHLHDLTVIAPAFHDGRAVALFGCCCHQVDIGGLGQGADGRSIYEEGLQIPPMKLVKAGELNEDLLGIVCENVRTPLGKFKALVLEPRMEKTPPKGMFKKGSTVHVWIALEDTRRLQEMLTREGQS